MSAITIEDEMSAAMHEFVEGYCREQTGELGDMIYFHEMIDNPSKRLLQFGGECESWKCFVEDFQEYISNQ